MEELVIPAVRGPRDIRNKMSIPRAQALPSLHLSTVDAAAAERLAPFAGLIRFLCGADAIRIGTDIARPPVSASSVTGGLTVYVPLEGLIDPEAEKKRLKAQAAKIGQQLAGVKAKLARPDFSDKAPAEVVEKERARATELEDQLKQLDGALRDLT
jgi:valyl-tRNA synthetase